jgi:DNA-directed RNA polymerase specialized sigma24 family protein
MREQSEGRVDMRVKDLVDRYAFHLERWTHGRTPMWARGAFDPRDVVHETLVTVVGECGQQPDRDQALLGRVRRALCDNVLARVRLARGVATSPDGSAQTSAKLHLHDSALAAELLERYETSLERLKPLDREAIIARAELGLPWSEVTDLLHKTGVAAARMTVSRAIVRLAREMSYER